MSTPAPASRRRALNRRERSRRRNRRAAFAVGGTLLFGIAFTGGLLAAPVDLTAPPPPKSALLLDRNGRFVASVRSPEAREEVPADQIPTVMRQAIIAAEDERFLRHGGVDPLAVIRATIKDLTGSATQGGSTITQQYVKNTFVGKQRTALRKIREAALAVRLERKLRKDEILTRYLNALYLGNGTYGVQAAAKYYFGKKIKDVDLAEAAMLAGIAPAPSRYNPVTSFKLALQRQKYTLNRMVANNLITSQQADAAYREGFQIVIKKQVTTSTKTVAPEFADYVEGALRTRFAGDEDALFRGGLRVTTSLDLDLQLAAVDAIKTVLPDPRDPEAAVVAIDPRTGDIRAMATRRENGYSRGGFNLATQAFPDSGSTVKPFTLAAALANGHTIDEVRYGPPCLTKTYPGQSKPYTVCNAEDHEGGTFSLKSALWQSINTIYSPLANEVGTGKVRSVLNAAGWKARNPARFDHWLFPSMGVGVEASPISVVHGYATLANHGERKDLRSILEIRTGGTAANDGTLDYAAPKDPKGFRAIPVPIADSVVDVMKGVVKYGTGWAARQPNVEIAGKTGTGDNFKSAWFVGCSPELCVGVWMGFDTPRPLLNVEGQAQVFGGTLPANIFSAVFSGYAKRTTPSPSPAELPPYVPVAPPSPSPSVKPSRTPSPKARPSVAPSTHPSAKPSPTTTGIPLPHRSRG